MTIATATVLGGLFGQFGSSLASVDSNSWARRRVAQLLSKKGSQALRAEMTALDGVVAGATALKTNARVDSNVELGGKRVIETETLINRVTTAADTTDIEATINNLTTKTTFGASPPANLDGNPLGTR